MFCKTATKYLFATVVADEQNLIFTLLPYTTNAAFSFVTVAIKRSITMKKREKGKRSLSDGSSQAEYWANLLIFPSFIWNTASTEKDEGCNMFKVTMQQVKSRWILTILDVLEHDQNETNPNTAQNNTEDWYSRHNRFCVLMNPKAISCAILCIINIFQKHIVHRNIGKVIVIEI